MVDKKLQLIIEEHDISFRDESNSNITNVVYLESNANPHFDMTVRYVSGRIYSVKFLNNDFFEMRRDSDLYKIIKAIIAGGYDVYVQGLFKRRKAISIRDHRDRLYPERVYSDKEYRKQYDLLPYKW